MITGFEKETAELTPYELENIVPIIVRRFVLKRGKKNIVTNKKIVEGLTKIGIETSEARIRKVINYIRINGIVPCIVANSNGYYVADSKEEIEEYIRSLEERWKSIKAVADQLQKQAELL